MLSRLGQRGLEAKIFGLSLGLVLGLMQCWPRSHEGCPRGLVVGHRNQITSFTLRSSLIGNRSCFILLELTFE